MSNAKYNYDENSETWPYFAITLVGVLVIPSTITTIASLFQGKAQNTNGSIESTFIASNEKEIQKFKSKSTASKIFNLKTLFLLIGWGILAYLTHYLAHKELVNTVAIFDPFEILGIASSATDKEVKSIYRKLSIKFHPDKLPTNLSDDEKLKAEDAFVKINKAYKALTDATTKENFLKYGHPDGPQAVTQGIALPKWLIESQGTYLVIIYVVGISILLPLIVRYWWNNAKSFTKKDVRTETSTMFVEQVLNYKPSTSMTPISVLKWISESYEIKEAYPKLSNDDIIKIFIAYTNRLPVSNEQAKLFVVSKAPTLLNGLLDIACYFRNTEIAIACIEALQCISTATPLMGTRKHQLLQLPNVNFKSINSQTEVKTLGKLFTIDSKKQKEVLGIKDDEKLQETLEVASKIPILKVLKAEFVVPGEEVIPPGSIAHIVVKVLVKSARHHGLINEKSTSEENYLEEETFETLKDPFKIAKSQPELPIAFTPYLPRSIQTSWSSLLSIQKDGRLVEQPTTVTNLDLSNLKLTSEEFKKSLEDGGKNLIVGTIKIPLTQPAPPKDGNYEFRLVLKSNTYFGCDFDIPLVMVVKTPSEVVDEKIYEIPAPSEDSVAGVLAQAKGEAVKSNGADDAYFDSDDEDELAEADGILDDDEDDDWSDIDTDTDEEDDEILDQKTK